MTVLDERLRDLTQAMDARCGWPANAPWVRRAMWGSLARHRFAPDRLWHWDGDGYVPVDRSADADRWARLVYAGPYASTITQVTDGLPTSSLSCVSVVADMLDCLMVEPGHRVLELGTGAGWNAALLAARVGPGRVTSVEVDAHLVDRARRQVRAAGVEAHIHCGDGALGWPADAPYDRAIATYAVDRVPWAWVAQTRPGGRIVTPWGRLGHVALTVADDGASASGWMQGLATFMPSRGTGPERTRDDIRDAHPLRVQGPVEIDVRALHTHTSLLFALCVLLPDVRIATEADARVTAWLHDGHSSWATLVTPDAGPVLGYQGGPRRLADEVGAAWRQWSARGAPGLYNFGMTVTATEQIIWSGDRGCRPRWETLVPPLPQ
ncbi:methyltransferase domain-containing protein [Streptomyces zagrosensis]|uniref:Protein-L-isoaspartate O-methyltransferase n=1 Tax=Streptomyces zagrosensis TaxID=1042984 RepID=A0A7W9V0D8_9ACTN|nr:methyltransferase domain-containing protein [Streptomyces zagrosensis]MBB5938055.1 protein-L-isoaspartate(D-aspartate) O-methyltransferase [Streptomyces zagrosensis]